MSVPGNIRLVKLPQFHLSCHIQHDLTVFPWVDNVSEHYEKVDMSGTFTYKAIEIKNRTHGPIRHHEKTKKNVSCCGQRRKSRNSSLTNITHSIIINRIAPHLAVSSAENESLG